MKKPIKRKSARGKLIAKADSLLFQLLKLKREAKCEISGRTEGVGTFHILDKATFPRIRHHEMNLLLVAWLPHHHNWHHYPESHLRNHRTREGIIRLRGADYEDKLKALNVIAPRTTDFQLELIVEGIKQELKRLAI